MRDTQDASGMLQDEITDGMPIRLARVRLRRCGLRQRRRNGGRRADEKLTPLHAASVFSLERSISAKI